MNYYKQGDAANADQIKAAWEKLGIKTSGYDFSCKDVLFFTFEVKGKSYMMSAVMGSGLDNIILTHQDYKELELPIVPKFKVGDWVANDYCAGKVIALTDDAYLLDSGQGIPFSCEHNAHLWTIADANDGDVLVTTKIRSCPFIYRKTSYKNNLAYYYAGIDGNGNFCEGCLKRTLCHFGSASDVAPATKEQRGQLFAKMKEAGYEWDEKKKELRKIQPHYDIANLQPFDKVLCRNCNNDRWRADYFSHLSKNGKSFIAIGYTWCQCIPFEGNEHLLGTTDMPSEEYINW